MKKYLAIFFPLLFISTMMAFPEGPFLHKGQNGFTLSGTWGADSAASGPMGTAGFSLSAIFDLPFSNDQVTLDRRGFGDLTAAEIQPELTAHILKRNSSPAPVSMSVFLGRGNDSFFSSLLDEYIWELKIGTLSFGASIYRDIPISKGIHIQPYVSFVHARAHLRPSDYYGNSEDMKYRLTAFCFGVPLVYGF